MGKSHNIKSYSDEYANDYEYEVKNVRRGNKKKVAKYKDYGGYQSDSR